MNRNRRKTKSEFIHEAVQIHGSRYLYDKIVYYSNKQSIEIICRDHGAFKQSPKTHLRGANCPKCMLREKMIDKSIEFLDSFVKRHGDKFDYSKVVYSGHKNPVTIICPKHGEFRITPPNHLLYDCKKCYYEIIGKNLTKKVDEFIEQASKIHSNYYDYSLVVYTNTHSYVIVICPKHGKFKQNPSNHLMGQGCPTCRRSKGEVAISVVLSTYNFEYVEQYKFQDCRNLLPLPFDFYLPDFNICIEYDGKQHFEESKSWFYKQDVIKTDEIKTYYCHDNNIPLLRISYKNFKKIEKIIINFMSNYKKISQEDKNNIFIDKSIKFWGFRYDYSKIEYVDSLTPVLIGFKGKYYKQTPTKHLQGKKIENTIRKMSTIEFIEKSINVWGPKRFNYSECEYMGTNDPVRLFDNIKNKWITQTAKSHLKGFEVSKYDIKDFIQMCNLIYDYKYKYDDIKYESLISRIKINCPEHGIFELKSSSHLLSLSHCPKCKDFVGEKEIVKFLDKNDIIYVRQHKFPNCKNIFQLPFDFYIPSLRMCIEFDGKQHFQPMKFFGGLSAYNQLKINDKIKSDYCEENYIDLIRIRYDQIDNINDILYENLNRI